MGQLRQRDCCCACKHPHFHHLIVREGLRLLLDTSEDMFVVGEAADGRVVLDQVPLGHPTVILLDLRMPPLQHRQYADGRRCRARLNAALRAFRILPCSLGRGISLWD